MSVSHPDKELFPGRNITKADVVHYYDRIANHILPYLADRPLTLERYPDGITSDGFYQKNASEHFPDFIERVELEPHRLN